MKIGLDISALMQIANFLCLILILDFVLYKPIRGILRQRKDKFEGLKGDIGTLAGEVEEKDAAFREAVKDARAKGMQAKDGIIGEAAAEEKRIVEEINKKAQADLAVVKAKISADAESARASLKKEVEAFAYAICEKILGRAV
ncbi:ATP synthase F0 subunit B [Desulforegula conservatrix]|uniref:ATP synthase F0 subunit B n=1 Tax=Desulforegula conservatrix TaxID=153026 RepID=UPI00040C2673|nr:ATP synthase F0 subunit B [Desulforegula conservatrix]